MHPRQVKQFGILFILLGSVLLALGVWGLWRDVEWIAQPLYAYGWWGWIFILDGIRACLRKDSLFTTRRKLLFPTVVWSITFWFFFELLNLYLQNWYYVGVLYPTSWLSLLLCVLFPWLCFATVFTGLFETYDLLTAIKWIKTRNGKPRAYPKWVSYFLQFLGVVMMLSALIDPYWLAPLIWGSVTFLIDPWNYRRGARSILRDFESGNWGSVVRLLLAGLICGLVWESFNFLAPQKWIYTVRGLEHFKLFEMPLLGFIGFPALALDAMAVFSFLSYQFLGNQSWEPPQDLNYSLSPRPSGSSRLFFLTLPIQIVFWLGVDVGIMKVNIGSFQLQLSDLPSVTDQVRMPLEEKGIHRPRQLIHAVKDSKRREELQLLFGDSQEEFQTLLNQARLYTFKGIGAPYGYLLNHLGIEKVEQLEQFSPDILHEELTRIAGEHGIQPPRLDMVKVWVFAAGDRGMVQKVN